MAITCPFTRTVNAAAEWGRLTLLGPGTYVAISSVTRLSAAANVACSEQNC